MGCYDVILGYRVNYFHESNCKSRCSLFICQWGSWLPDMPWIRGGRVSAYPLHYGLSCKTMIHLICHGFRVVGFVVISVLI
jgi:hypothetical protein